MNLTEGSEAFLVSLEDENFAQFQAYIDQHHSRLHGFDFKETLQAMPKKQTQRLCTGLLKQVNISLNAIHSTEDTVSAEIGQQGTQQAAAADALRGAALFAIITLQENTSAPPEGLAAVAEMLHDEALLMVPKFPELQEAVAKLCIAWWQGNTPGKEALIAQTLPFVLVKALSSGKSADVKRCHVMRAALPLLDFEDESIQDLKRLLLRAAFSPAFLRPAEGRRFLSYLFNLQPQLVRELGAIVRNQIPAGRKSVLDAYGDVLQRAWRESTGACLLEVEDQIQGLMHAAILASTPAMSAALRRVLDGLHGQKAHPLVDAMLLRLYEPILFRGLSAANPAVRRNAVQLLFDAFPLQDPQAENEATDELLTRQFAAIGSCLGDAAPAVRCAAVTGICSLLNTYWELIPAATIAAFLKRITGDLAFDGASPGVRAAVLDGLSLLVENPIAQPLLKVLLPHLSPLLWDAALKVRVAFADLLLCVQRVRALSVAEIVSPDALLEALGSDAPGVTQRIQRLLLPSYFPNSEEGPAVVAYLLRTSPNAGKAFCRCLVGTGKQQGPLVPLEDLEALAVALRDHLLATAPAANARPKPLKARKGKRKTDEAEPQQALAHSEKEVETAESWQAILEGLAEVCSGITAITGAGGDIVPTSLNVFDDGHLLRLLDLAQDSRGGRTAVLNIAAALPNLPASAEIHARCLEEVASLGPATPQSSIPHLVRCAMAGDGETSLLETLLAALRLTPEEASDSGQIGPSKAAQVVNALLGQDDTRPAVLQPIRATEMLRALQEAAEDSCANLSEQLGAESGAGCSLRDPAFAINALGKTALHLRLTTDCQAAEQPLPTNTPAAGNLHDDSRGHLHEANNALAKYLELAEIMLDRLAELSHERLYELAEQAGEAGSPKKKRSKATAQDAAAVPACVAALREAWQICMGCLALFSDAAQLLSCLPHALSACAYAQRQLEWVTSLPADILQGALFGSQDPAADMVALAARLACFVIANQAASAADEGTRNLGPSLSEVPLTVERGGREPLSELGQPADSDATVPMPGVFGSSDDGRLMALVIAVMEATVKDEDSRVPALRPFVVRLLEGVRSKPHTLADPRWIAPIASAVGAEVLQLRSEMGDATEVLATEQIISQRGGDAEASGEETIEVAWPEQDENVDIHQPSSSRCEAAGKGKQGAVVLQRPLARALITAAKSAKVLSACADLAARAALEALKAQQAVTLLGALHLLPLLGVQGLNARERNGADAETFAVLERVQVDLTASPESKDDKLAVTLAKAQLKALLPRV